MNRVIVGVIGLVCAAVWLVLLVVTAFHAGVVGVGLLVTLAINGSAPGPLRNPPRTVSPPPLSRDEGAEEEALQRTA
jgi:hypothetical protein